MSAAITLSNLGWSTPDGRVLFSNLNFTFGVERCGLVGRNGVGKSTLLDLIAGRRAPQSGIVTGGGKSALLRQSMTPDPHTIVADLFGARDGLAVLARAEAGCADADDLADADWTLEPRLSAALDRLALAVEPSTPLTALSGGQRTRAALAALIFSEPDFLLLDEPTNNLDRDGRAAVADLLDQWRGGAIVVSHDRDLLEGMDAIVDLTSLGATRYGGGWSLYRKRKTLELAAAEHDLAAAEQRLGDLAQNAQINAERKARKDGVGKRGAARGGQPRILLGARKERSEGTSGEAARLVERRRQEALDAATAARGRLEVLQPLAVQLPSTRLPSQRTVLKLAGVTAGYDRTHAVIVDFSLVVTGPERIAVAGPNGSGKSTLLAVISGALPPWRGEVQRLAPLVMLDQQVSLLQDEATLRDNFHRLNPQADDNQVRATLARFMFRNDAALQPARTLSGGQRLRAGLACVLGAAEPPALLILDEPTNHLDLDAIEAVEKALAAYDGALIIVSHDEAFLEGVGVTRRVDLATSLPAAPHAKRDGRP